jgi:membrane-associated phospholipid phosphatase
MPRGTKSRRQAAPRPLLPPALRRPAAVLVIACATVTASLALAFAGQSRPGGLDAAVDAHVRSALGPYRAQTNLLAGLGGLGPVTVLTAALVLACLVTRRWRGAALAGLAVPAAVALTEYVLKPLVGRTIRGDPSFPSGHATAMFALAATCAVLLAGPARPRLPGAVRLLLVFGAALVAAAVATAMVALGYHYFTDAVAGTAVAIGVVLLTALLIDRAARAPRAESRGDAGVPITVTTSPDVSTRSAGQN